MKILIALGILFSSLTSYAGTNVINCIARGDLKDFEFKLSSPDLLAETSQITVVANGVYTGEAVRVNSADASKLVFHAVVSQGEVEADLIFDIDPVPDHPIPVLTGNGEIFITKGGVGGIGINYFLRQCTGTF
jgi:hypothetical protein